MRGGDGGHGRRGTSSGVRDSGTGVGGGGGPAREGYLGATVGGEKKGHVVILCTMGDFSAKSERESSKTWEGSRRVSDFMHVFVPFRTTISCAPKQPD